MTVGAVLLRNNNSPIAVTTAPAANSIPVADGNGTLNSWINVNALIALPVTLNFACGGGVPSNGYKYLNIGDIACTSATTILNPSINPPTLSFTSINMIVKVDTSDTSDYNFELITNPTTGIVGIFGSTAPNYTPTVLATIFLANGSTSASGGAAAVISDSTELGIRLVRLTGSSASLFSNVSVSVTFR